MKFRNSLNAALNQTWQPLIQSTSFCAERATTLTCS
jgi:hypothetical protein